MTTARAVLFNNTRDNERVVFANANIDIRPFRIRISSTLREHKLTRSPGQRRGNAAVCQNSIPQHR